MADLRENCLEWIDGDDRLWFSLTQKKYITIVEKLAAKRPNDVQILERNSNGSIYGHMTLKALHLSIIEKNLTDEQRKAATERLKKAKEKADDV